MSRALYTALVTENRITAVNLERPHSKYFFALKTNIPSSLITPLLWWARDPASSLACKLQSQDICPAAGILPSTYKMTDGGSLLKTQFHLLRWIRADLASSFFLQVLFLIRMLSCTLSAVSFSNFSLMMEHTLVKNDFLEIFFILWPYSRRQGAETAMLSHSLWIKRGNKYIPLSHSHLFFFLAVYKTGAKLVKRLLPFWLTGLSLCSLGLHMSAFQWWACSIRYSV